VRRPLGSIAAIALLSVGTNASAAGIAKSLCSEALKTDGILDPIDLRSVALTGISQDTLDYNHDGSVSAAEVLDALTTDAGIFCTVAKDGSPGRVKACGDGAEEALANADNDLASFWEARGATYEIATIRAPTSGEVQAEGGLARRDWAVLLDDRKRFAQMVCKPGNEVAETPTSSHFLAGADIDSLTVARLPAGQKDRLKKVNPAALSFASDNVADTRTFAIGGVAGYQVLSSTRFKLTPFVQYTRNEVEDKKAGTEKLTGKFGVGAVGTFILGSDQLDVAPLFSRDLKNHAAFVGGRFAWRPGFLYRLDPFRNAVHFACAREINPQTGKSVCKLNNGLAVWTDFQMIASVGTVVDDGNDPAAIEGKDFVRIGPSAALHIYGLSGLAKDFSFDATAKRLITITGGGRPVYALKADLSYWIGGSEHLSLTSGYEYSRDEETLQPTDKWKVGLGLRF
jgi:hypothetical protein